MQDFHMRFKRLDPEADAPSRKSELDAGFDLTSMQDITLQPGERALVPTGIALEIRPGFAGYIQPRSGLAAKQGLSIVNTPGLIDSNYRGEIKVCLINTDKQNPISISKHDRIAQLVIIFAPNVLWTEADTLSETDRGEAGFGSSGTQVFEEDR